MMDQIDTKIRKKKRNPGRARDRWYLEHSHLQRDFLDALMDQNVSVAIFMVNGVRLVGTIGRYDMFAIELRSGKSGMMAKIDAISTIAPLGKFRWKARETEIAESG